MNFNDYQELSQTTAEGYADPQLPDESMGAHYVQQKEIKEKRVLFLALALNGEAGELGEKVKKYVREDDEEYLEGAKDELGDVLWYLAQIASLLDVNLDDVAEDNMDKLLDRQERDMIMGEGDNR